MRSILLAFTALSLAAAANALAQRRTTDGGGSGRSAPSSGGSGGGGRSTSSGGSRSSGSRGNTGSERSGRPSDDSRGTGSAQASGSSRPTSGKIGAIRRSAHEAKASGGVLVERGVYLGGCWDCDYWGYYHGRYGWYHGGWWYPPRYPHYVEPRGDGEEGQGYLPYPYSENDGTGSTFVEQHSPRAAFGSIGGQFFSDVGSTTTAGRFQVEGAYRSLRGEAEYSSYREPVANGVDYMQTFRIGVGMQPRLGNNAYLIVGVGARGLYLGNGDNAGGAEGELGVQVFPARPLGINVTGRLAGMSWTGGADYFTLKELNTTGSIFVGRIELQGGWHWMRVGDNPAFGGPMFGTRIWF